MAILVYMHNITVIGLNADANEPANKIILPRFQYDKLLDSSCIILKQI